MHNYPLVKITPRQIDNEGTLTITSDTQAFAAQVYRITDESERVIRQGSSTPGLCELKLFIVGFKAGNYQVIIGNESLRFTVT